MRKGTKAVEFPKSHEQYRNLVEYLYPDVAHASFKQGGVTVTLVDERKVHILPENDWYTAWIEFPNGSPVHFCGKLHENSGNDLYFFVAENDRPFAA